MGVTRRQLQVRLFLAILVFVASAFFIATSSDGGPAAPVDEELTIPRLQNPNKLPATPDTKHSVNAVNAAKASPPRDKIPPKNQRKNQHNPAITVAEVISTFNSFLHVMHDTFARNKDASPVDIWGLYHDLAVRTLLPFDEQYAERMPKRRSDDSIFLSLASYRDENCLPTLTQAYEKAKRPQQLFVGLVQQNCLDHCRSGVLEGGAMEDVEPDEDCGALFCASRPDLCDNVRVLRINETEALGPYAGRYFGSKLWSGESWYMQIDSHMTFAQDWDALSIEMLTAAPSPKPVLTHYPPSHTAKLPQVGPRICEPIIADSAIEAQIVRLMGAPTYEKSIGKTPRFAPFVAAGYFVAHSSFLSDVPFDPLMPWIFMGEEISMSARLFTSGYDIFSPTQSVTGHIYVRRHKPKFWETFGRVFRHGLHNPVQLVIIQRLKHTLGYPEAAADLIKPATLLTSIDRYTMGTERPLSQYMDMVGIDVVNKQILPMERDWCTRGKPPPGFEQFDDLYKNQY
jgi:hypothetical protein